MTNKQKTYVAPFCGFIGIPEKYVLCTSVVLEKINESTTTVVWDD